LPAFYIDYGRDAARPDDSYTCVLTAQEHVFVVQAGRRIPLDTALKDGLVQVRGSHLSVAGMIASHFAARSL
jgi:hypothetical protein